MKKIQINRIFILSAIVFMIFSDNCLLSGESGVYDYTGENILYLVSPIGKSEYNNLGIVDLKGVKVNLVTFRTKVLFFEDAENIYSDPESLLPYRIERAVSKLWAKEYIIEEYDQEKFIVNIKKFKAGKQVSEQVIKTNGPIQNPILLLSSYMRNRSDLEIGWHFTARIPAEFELELVSIDEITVPAGKFQAYHFKSIPDKFEIWINKDVPRIPLKVQSKNYSLLMKKRDFRNN